MLTASSDGRAKIGDAEIGVEELPLKQRDIAISSDGRSLVTSSNDHSAKIRNAETGKELLVLRGHEKAIFCTAFSHDEQSVLTASDYKTIKVWDAESGNEHLTLKGHKNRVSSAAFSLDGHRLVSANRDKVEHVWDAETGRELLACDSVGIPTACSFYPDGIRAITESGPANFWEAWSLTKEEYPEHQRQRYEEWVESQPSRGETELIAPQPTFITSSSSLTEKATSLPSSTSPATKARASWVSTCFCKNLFKGRAP